MSVTGVIVTMLSAWDYPGEGNAPGLCQNPQHVEQTKNHHSRRRQILQGSLYLRASPGISASEAVSM